APRHARRRVPPSPRGHQPVTTRPRTITERPRTAPVAPARMVWRGVTKRCPQCGQGHLFQRWFTLVPECPRCNLRFDRGEEGYWTGAMAVNIVITQTLFFIAFPLALVL